MGTVRIEGQEFEVDKKKGTMKFHIKEPYYTAGRKYGWSGTMVGVSISQNALIYAFRHGLEVIQITVGRNTKVWEILAEVWDSIGEDLIMKHTKLRVVQWSNNNFSVREEKVKIFEVA